MTFVEKIVQRLRDRADRCVLTEIHPTYLREVSGRQLLSKMGSVQEALAAHAVTKGDRVVVIAPNGVSWIACDLAILASGAVCVPMYHRQELAEIVYMIQDCAPKLVIVAQSLVGDVRARILSGPAILSIDEVFSKPRPPKIHPIAPKECVTFCYTSGTSGNPKGAMISRENVEFMLRRTTESLKQANPGAKVERVFHFLPFCFMGSRMSLWTQLHRGNHLWLSTDLTRLKEELAVADPHYYLNVPAVLERIRVGVEGMIAQRSSRVRAWFESGRRSFLDPRAGTAKDRVLGWTARKVLFRAIRRKIGKRLRFLICGSAPLREETQRWFEMIGIPVLQVYGLTETTAIVTMDRLGQVSPGFVGFPIEGCETKVTEEGELLCRGPNTFLGYWNLPDETSAMLRDGWLHTGDQVEFDTRGRLKVIGRVKNILVSENGHNVAPEPLEERLLGLCPGAEHVVVIGHGRPFLTALVTGAVEPARVQSAIDQINEGVPHYRKIRGFHVAREPLSVEKGHLTANQKLRRKAIEAYFERPIADLYVGGQKSL